MDDIFPFEYVGGGYFRRKGAKPGVPAEILHGQQAIDYVIHALTAARHRLPYPAPPPETPVTVTRHQLFHFLSSGNGTFDDGGDDTAKVPYADFVENLDDDDPSPLTEAEYNQLLGCDIRQIVADSEMSEHHLGGDNLVDMADAVIKAIEDGYEVVTWYGPNSETLVAGIRTNQLEVVD